MAPQVPDEMQDLRTKAWNTKKVERAPAQKENAYPKEAFTKHQKVMGRLQQKASWRMPKSSQEVSQQRTDDTHSGRTTPRRRKARVATRENRTKRDWKLQKKYPATSETARQARARNKSQYP